MIQRILIPEACSEGLFAMANIMACSSGWPFLDNNLFFELVYLRANAGLLGFKGPTSPFLHNAFHRLFDLAVGPLGFCFERFAPARQLADATLLLGPT